MTDTPPSACVTHEEGLGSGDIAVDAWHVNGTSRRPPHKGGFRLFGALVGVSRETSCGVFHVKHWGLVPGYVLTHHRRMVGHG